MNINNYIFFKPTAAGENVMLTYPYITDSDRTPDENGYHTMQFWEFCNMFGPHFFNGGKQLFINNDVLFEDPSKDDITEDTP